MSCSALLPRESRFGRPRPANLVAGLSAVRGKKGQDLFLSFFFLETGNLARCRLQALCCCTPPEKKSKAGFGNLFALFVMQDEPIIDISLVYTTDLSSLNPSKDPQASLDSK